MYRSTNRPTLDEKVALPDRRFLTADLPWGVDPLVSAESGVLCLGFLLAPGEASLLQPGREIGLPQGVWWIEFDTGGTATITRSALGLLAKVPCEDPLARLAASYYETDFPGYTDWMDWKTPFADVLEGARRLGEIGLEIDPNEYAHLAEALIPIEFDSTWAHVERQRLQLVLEYDPRERPIKLGGPELLGIESAVSARHYLQGAWDSVVHQLYEHPPAVRPKQPLGMMIIANSD